MAHSETSIDLGSSGQAAQFAHVGNRRAFRVSVYLPRDAEETAANNRSGDIIHEWLNRVPSRGAAKIITGCTSGTDRVRIQCVDAATRSGGNEEIRTVECEGTATIVDPDAEDHDDEEAFGLLERLFLLLSSAFGNVGGFVTLGSNEWTAAVRDGRLALEKTPRDPSDPYAISS